MSGGTRRTGEFVRHALRPTDLQSTAEIAWAGLYGREKSMFLDRLIRLVSSATSCPYIPRARSTRLRVFGREQSLNPLFDHLSQKSLGLD